MSYYIQVGNFVEKTGEESIDNLWLDEEVFGLSEEGTLEEIKTNLIDEADIDGSAVPLSKEILIQ